MCKIQKKHIGKEGVSGQVCREKRLRPDHGEAAARQRSRVMMTVSCEGLSLAT